MVVGLIRRLLAFYLDIIGITDGDFMPIFPTDHQIWQVPNDKDDLNQSAIRPMFRLGIGICTRTIDDILNFRDSLKN